MPRIKAYPVVGALGDSGLLRACDHTLPKTYLAHLQVTLCFAKICTWPMSCAKDNLLRTGPCVGVCDLLDVGCCKGLLRLRLR